MQRIEHQPEGSRASQIARWLAWALFLFFSVTTMVGVIKNYSPVPFWDMWDGYLNFYTQVDDGVASAWWSQHAEHRIVVGNLFFWLDLKYLDGTAILLFFLNYAFVLLIAALLSLAFAKSLNPEEDKWIRDSAMLTVFAIMLSWVQQENLTWAFQASFFPSLLLPLLSLLVLSESLYSRRVPTFILALALGMLSAGTMANGLATLPLMAALAYLRGEKAGRLFPLIVASVLVTALYFHGYKSPEMNGSIVDSLAHSKADMARYLLIYLGGIFGYMFPESNLLAAELAGFGSLVLIVFLTRGVLRNKSDKHAYVLLMFVAYILVSGAATAGARLKFGLDQALSSRYMTYSLAYWSALLLMLVSLAKPTLRKRPYLVPLILAVPLLLASYQFNALKDTTNRNYDRLLAGLAMEMGVRDSSQIMNIFPWIDVGFILAERPRDRNLSIFGNPLIADVRERMDREFPVGGSGKCGGSLGSAAPIADDPGYVKLTGWISNTTDNKSPSAVAFVNSRRQLVGYGLSEAALAGTMLGSMSPETGRVRFAAYLRSSELDHDLMVYGRTVDCVVKIGPDAGIFRVSLVGAENQ